jgi:hypothetical protein
MHQIVFFYYYDKYCMSYHDSTGSLCNQCPHMREDTMIVWSIYTRKTLKDCDFFSSSVIRKRYYFEPKSTITWFIVNGTKSLCNQCTNLWKDTNLSLCGRNKELQHAINLFSSITTMIKEISLQIEEYCIEISYNEPY